MQAAQSLTLKLLSSLHFYANSLSCHKKKEENPQCKHLEVIQDPFQFKPFCNSEKIWESQAWHRGQNNSLLKQVTYFGFDDKRKWK